MIKNKVFIKNVAIVSPLGNDLNIAYENFLKNNINQKINRVNYQSNLLSGNQLVNNYDRVTLINLLAAQECLSKTGDLNKFGIIIGTTYGCLDSLLTSEQTFLIKGFLAYNPALFPNTVYNAVASQINIYFKNKSLSEVVCANRISGLVAIGEAFELLKGGYAEDILAGGYDEISDNIPLKIYLDNIPEMPKEMAGKLGEGAGLFLLSKDNYPTEKNLAEIISYSYAYKAKSKPIDSLKILAEAVQKADIPKEKIVCVFSNNATPAEFSIYKKYFGRHFKNLKIINLKPLIGECFSAYGSFQMALAIWQLRENQDPGFCIISGLSNDDYNCCLVIKKAE